MPKCQFEQFSKKMKLPKLGVKKIKILTENLNEILFVSTIEISSNEYFNLKVQIEVSQWTMQHYHIMYHEEWWNYEQHKYPT